MIDEFLRDEQFMRSCPFATQIKGNENLVIYFTNIYRESEDNARHLGSAIRAYLQSIRTNRKYLPMQYIITDERSRDYKQIPLPRVFTQLKVSYEFLDKSPLSSKKETIVPAIKAIHDKRHTVVLGDPGAGKGTLTDYLTLIMAYLVDKHVDDEQRDGYTKLLLRDSNNSWKDDYCFPIPISLSEFAASKEFREERQGSSDMLAMYIANRVVGAYKYAEKEIHGYILELLQQGKALILLDGLDHLPGILQGNIPSKTRAAEERNKLKDILNQFTLQDGYKENRVVVTSRSYAYRRGDEWHLAPHFEPAELQPFDKEQITQFVKFWNRVILDIERAKVGADAIDPDDDEQIDKVDRDAISYATQIIKTHHMYELATSPLLLTYMVCRYHPTRGIPSVNRMHLYDGIIEMLIEHWSRPPDSHLGGKAPTLYQRLDLNSDQLKMLMAIVAFDSLVPSINENGQVNPMNFNITEDTLYRAWDRLCMAYRLTRSAPDPKTWEELKTRNGILLPIETIIDDEGKHERFVFPHQSLAEALAAKAVNANKPKLLPPDWLDETLGILIKKPHVSELIMAMVNQSWERWNVVIRMALEDKYRIALGDAEDIVDSLLEINEANLLPIDDPENPRWYGAIIACDFITKNIGSINNGYDEKMKLWLLSVLKHQAMKENDRQQAASHLAILGDPRFTLLNIASYENWSLECANQSENVWTLAPTTRILLGSPDRTEQRVAEQRPSNPARVVEEFYVSRFQVTNAMFDVFIEQGYENQIYWKWSPEAEQWHSKNQVIHALGLANEPRVQVCWYEALAFCEWLTAFNKQNLQISLLSEWQWIAAAVGEDDRSLLEIPTNVIGSKVCSIGVYPPNSMGLFDICGNVSEWTRSRWQEKLGGDDDISLSNNGSRRTLRGSSYYDVIARLHRRSPMDQGRREPTVGFRLIASYQKQTRISKRKISSRD